MASDYGGVGSPKWRTHTPLRMLTANDVGGPPSADNMVFSWGYYEGKPYCTADTEGHTGQDTGQSEFLLPHYMGPAGQKTILMRMPVTSAAVRYWLAQEAAGFREGFLGGYGTNGTWKNAANSLKRNTTLFTFNGHASPPGGQGQLAFWYDDKWQLLRGKDDGEAAPNGAVYHNFRDCWGMVGAPPLEERLKGVEFALLLGCHLVGAESYSISKELVLEGANAAGGFEVSVYGAPSTAFGLYFWNLAMGHDTDSMPDWAWGTEGPRPLDVDTAAMMALWLVRDAAKDTVYKDLVPADSDWRVYHAAGWQNILAPAGKE